MRTFTLSLCLVLTSALLLAAPGPARAGDDDGETARLVRRVEMLIDLVAQLRAEVVELRERVAELETERTDVREILVVPEIGAKRAAPVEPDGITDSALSWAEVSGVYTLDKEASIKTILEEQLEGVEDEELADMIRQGVADEFAEVGITLRIEANGTFFVRLRRPGTEEGPDEGTARGTWSRDESRLGPRQHLLFVTTHEAGIESASPSELVGSWEDGRLTLQEDEGGYVMVFDRN